MELKYKILYAVLIVGVFAAFHALLYVLVKKRLYGAYDFKELRNIQALTEKIKKVNQMSFEKVKNHLAAFGLQDRAKELSVSSATVEEAAAALGCEPCCIAKSMSFYRGSSAIIVVMAGDVKTDNPKFKAAFGCKPSMLKGDDIEKFTGYRPGGVCPFANPEGTQVYLDESLKRFDVVYPAAGTASSAVRLTLDELEKASASQSWVDVSKPY